MHRTRVKFCGITCSEDAQQAAAAGADAIGIVMYPQAATAVELSAVANIARAVPPLVNVVLLFVNAAPDFVRAASEAACPSLLQFHGDEDADYCRAFSRPYLKACRVSTADDIITAKLDFADARGILLDANKKGVYGGSGESFDWDLIPSANDNNTPPLIIAGGLSADTVGSLICSKRPWGVDVSSGIASADARRRKDYVKMLSFMEEVRRADQTSS